MILRWFSHFSAHTANPSHGPHPRADRKHRRPGAPRADAGRDPRLPGEPVAHPRLRRRARRGRHRGCRPDGASAAGPVAAPAPRCGHRAATATSSTRRTHRRSRPGCISCPRSSSEARVSDLHTTDSDAARSRAARARTSPASSWRGACLDAHRGEPADAERLHHRDRASRRSRGRAGRGPATGRRRRRAAHRRADRAQGPLLHAGCAHHLRLAHARQLRLALRRHRGREAEGRRRGHARQDEHGRVRHGLVQRDQLLRPGAQSLEPDAGARRLLGRLGGGGRGAPGAGRHRAPTPAARSASRRRCAASPA